MVAHNTQVSGSSRGQITAIVAILAFIIGTIGASIIWGPVAFALAALLLVPLVFLFFISVTL